MAAGFAEHLDRTESHSVGPPEPLQDASQFAEIGHAEDGANHSDGHKAFGRRHAGPLGRQGHDLGPVIDVEGAVLAPVVPVGQEIKFPPRQGMKGMGHKETSGPRGNDRRR
jgi:hypothetical protein